jgi:hypothetical protein
MSFQLADLPPELHCAILSFLGTKELILMSQLNVHWNNLAMSSLHRNPVPCDFRGRDSIAVHPTDTSTERVHWTMEFWLTKTKMCPTSSGILSFTPPRSVIKLEQFPRTKKLGITLFGVTDETFNITLPLGKEIHLAVVHDGQAVSAYVNGKKNGNVIRCFGDLRHMPCPWKRIGFMAPTDDEGLRRWPEESGLIGSLKAVACWNEARTKAQLRQSMIALLSTPPPGNPTSPSKKETEKLMLHLLFQPGSLLKRQSASPSQPWEEYLVKDYSPKRNKVIMYRTRPIE